MRLKETEEDMKLIVTLIAASSLLAAVAIAQPVRYSVKDLGTLSGTYSAAYGLNNAGQAGGVATVSNGNQHAFLWDRGQMSDLGTLGGSNSIAGGPNRWDELPIEAETSTTDPLGENFCGFGTGLTCLGAIWKNRTMTPLPTLGGNNAIAISLNDAGQVTGYAENSTHDPSCPAPQVLDFEAVIWGPDGRIQELRPLHGDTVGLALGINDLGQVVGASGSCANSPLFPLAGGPHAVLWSSGKATNLGNLGGTTVNTAASINDRGEVVGASELAGDTDCNPFTLVGCTLHAFLWTEYTGMQDIGTLNGDVQAFPAGMGGINDNGQVVGASCNISGSCRAFLWQDRVMLDLNTLIPADSTLYLLFATGINAAGEIAGFGVTNGSEVHAFVATPTCREADNENVAHATKGQDE
jgi:probable HAF family extracellular repeat protein